MTNEEFIKAISFEGEEWKDIVGFEKLYMISTYGRVISLKRYILCKNNRKVLVNPKLLKPCVNNKNGYLDICLWKNNKQQHMYIHRAVAISFIPNKNKYKLIDHIDTNRTNNHVDNLRWCTPSMNNLNPISNKKFRDSINNSPKVGIPIVGISLLDSKDIRFYKSSEDTRKDGFCPSCVSKVCTGFENRAQHKNFDWYFLEDYETLINKSKNSFIPKEND